MNDTLFHVGDEFVGDIARTWGALKIFDVLPRHSTYYDQRYRCATTRHDGSPGPTAVLYEKTLRRYRRARGR